MTAHGFVCLTLALAASQSLAFSSESTIRGEPRGGPAAKQQQFQRSSRHEVVDVTAEIGAVSALEVATVERWRWPCNDVSQDATTPGPMGSWAATIGCVLIFILKCSMPAILETSDVSDACRKVRPITMGIFCQFIIMPLSGAFCARCLRLSSVQGIALLIATSCPGGSFSNWLCHIFNGDLALSISMTGVSTFVGMIFVPISIFSYSRLLYDKDVMTACQWFGIVVSLATLLAGLVVGLGLSKVLQGPQWRDRFAAIGALCGLSLFGLILAISSSGNESAHETTPPWKKPWWLYAGLLITIAGAMSLSLLLASAPMLKLTNPERLAAVFEVVYQNTALGGVIVLQVFEGDARVEAAAVIMIYAIFQNLLLGVFGVAAHYAGWSLASPGTSLSQALITNFQKKGPSATLVQ